MAEIASAYVSLLPSTRGFGRATSSQINPQLSKSGTAAGGVLGKSLLKGFIAIGAATAVARFLGDSVAEARQSQKVGALTAQVIKDTGSAAKVTATQVSRLSTALSKKVGIDDEEIQSGSNLILTFKNIRREGSGLDNIFARATRAGVDLAASGFGSIESASKTIGKALNDPIKGLTALGRAGVTFSAQQVTQIKNAVANNNVLRAQRNILREVESQVKGTAEAQATNADRARVALGNLKEQIGTALLPALDALSGIFANKIAPALSNFITNLQTGGGAAGSFGAYLRTNIIGPIGKSLPSILASARAGFNQVRKAISDNKPELIQLGNAAKRLIPVLGFLAGTQLRSLGVQLRVVITVVGLAVKQFNVLRSVGTAVGKAIVASVAFFEKFAQGVRQKFSNVISYAKSVPGKIKSAVGSLGRLLYGAGEAIIDGLIAGITAKFGALKSKLSEVGGFIKAHKGPPSADKVMLVPAGQLIMDGLIAGIESRQKKLGDTLEKVGKKIKEKISKIRDTLTGLRGDFAALVEPIASNFTQGLFDFDTASAFTANLSTVKGTLATLIANFTKLKGEGLSPGFLYQLFQSGGPGLINSLAALDTAGAQSAAALFGDVTSLSDQLGTAVAGSTDKGAAIEKQTTRLEHKLDQLIHHVDHAADRTGLVINGTAANGHRRGK